MDFALKCHNSAQSWPFESKLGLKNALHIAQLLRYLGYASSDRPLQIAEENAACVAQAKSGIRHVRNAKHYQVKLRFLLQHVVDRTVEFAYFPTDYLLSDSMTNP